MTEIKIGLLKIGLDKNKSIDLSWADANLIGDIILRRNLKRKVEKIEDYSLQDAARGVLPEFTYPKAHWVKRNVGKEKAESQSP